MDVEAANLDMDCWDFGIAERLRVPSTMLRLSP
jgi:hypothetical protein